MTESARAAAQSPAYEKAPSGTRWLENGALRIKVLVEAANLGSSDVEIGEITFPVGMSPARGHRHGAIEIFYVLEGELDHVVNGTSHLLKPGMVGIVRPGDEVIHRVASSVPVRALVIWAPGGEVARIAPAFQQRPIGADGR
jgi:uncharacterized cupin superfamily protein